MNSIEAAKLYLPILDEIYQRSALTSILDGDEVTVKKSGVGEIKIAKLSMDGLGDFDRNDGYTKGDTSLVWETIKYDKERSQKFRVDRLDNEESLNLPAVRLMSEFMKTKVVPETDAARIAKIAGTDGISKKSETLVGGEAVISALRACINKFNEDEVDYENRILFITPTLRGGVDDLDTIKSKKVFESFSTVIEVPQSRMYTAVTLNTGEEDYGYKKAEGAFDINFLAVQRRAAVTAMEQYIKYFSPDEDQDGDSHIFPYRNYNLYGHVYENKTAGVYCSYKGA